MKTRCIFLAFCLLSVSLYAQTGIAPGALENLEALLNKPTVVRPAASAAASERNWYSVDIDTHMFTDEASFRQVVSVLTDVENYGSIFDGRSTKLRTSIVSRGYNTVIADITSITVAFIRFTIKYRASVSVLENGRTVFTSEVQQIDNDSNREIRNYHSIRHVEEVTVNGKKYIYIRIGSQSENHIGIRLSNITNTIERNSVSSNEDTLKMIIDAAKGR